MTDHDFDKLERRYRRTSSAILTGSAILLVVMIALCVWWFALAVTP